MNGHKKRTSLAASSMAAMLSCILLFSCNNEDLFESKKSENTCDNICFGITPREKAQTRGDVGGNEIGYTSERFVLRSEESTDTLCMHAVVSEGINSSALDSKRVITRGVPVTSDNFDAFHVVAYWKKNNDLQSQFYMDVDAAKKGNNLWSSEQTYYWPGAGNTLQFVAWAPAEIFSPSATDQVLSYTVPEEAANQQDIVVAKTEEIGGDYNKEVPLTFQHICTAVRFVVGSQMQPGTIKSVALKGVKNAGTYNMITGTWTLDEAATDFSQVLEKPMTGSETDGTEVTTDEGTFMLLPQTLPSDAKVEVVFINANGVERTLTASIGNATWEMGTTVTYKLSITPEYEFNIEVPQDKQDAHYISFPITVNVKDYDGAWTLTSNLPNDVFFTETKTDLQKQGYWIDEDKGTATISHTGSGSFTYYVYVTENTGDVARDLQFHITTQTAGAEIATAAVQQLCPSWNGNIGCERIEDGEYPWGFKWDRKVTYTFKGINLFLKWIFENRFETTGTYYTYIMKDYIVYKIATVSIDYTKLSILDGANDDDGLVNTKYLYNYTGSGGNIDELEQFCIDYTSLVGDKFEKVTEEGSLSLPQNYAAFEALKCNKFNKQEIGNDEEKIIMPLLKDENIVWYLPSSSECELIDDKIYPLEGDYWTSNAVDNNRDACYCQFPGKKVQYTDRLKNNKVRAVRKKP